ncbi:hypothetical protein ABZ801_01055 [Actinomadura sp. NPDC047616]|uniref:hypothetical protein n=1 Tax=Actinomadura sp. NPDC047616 TaxID=3155914 RepID=UPI0034031AFA
MGVLAYILGRETLIIVNPGPSDPHGDPTGQDDRTIVPGCNVQPAGSNEVLDGRDTVTTRMRVFAPSWAPVTATSRVEWNQQTWHVEGSPGSWSDPAGTPHHLEFLITRTTG